MASRYTHLQKWRANQSLSLLGKVPTYPRLIKTFSIPDHRLRICDCGKSGRFILNNGFRCHSHVSLLRVKSWNLWTQSSLSASYSWAHLILAEEMHTQPITIKIKYFGIGVTNSQQDHACKTECMLLKHVARSCGRFLFFFKQYYKCLHIFPF